LAPLPLGRPRGRPDGTGFGLRLDGDIGGRPRLRFAGWSALGLAGGGVDAIVLFFYQLLLLVFVYWGFLG
jgi:hypothetical protein